MKHLLVIVLVVASACSRKESSFKSNFASVTIDGTQILDAKTSKPYTGKLVAIDQEVSVVAKAVLGATTFERAAEVDPTGLVLVIPVVDGVASGRATAHVDLYAKKLNPELSRRSDEALMIARAKSSSIKLAEATFKVGKLDGPATVFAPNPKTGSLVKAAEVQFRDHVIDGLAIEYYPGTTQKMRELAIERGVQTGPQRWFYANGKLEKEATYIANRPDGEVKEYYADGKPRARGAFAKGEPIGTHEGWYPSGQRRYEIVYGDESPRETRWYSNGQSKAEPPNGTIEEFYGDGTLQSRTNYAAGVKHGLHQEWWKNGQPSIEARYTNGQLDGTYRRWYASGQVWETVKYAQGNMVGPYRKYWKNGKPAHVYAYNDNGKLDGEYKLFYDNGKKWAIAKYENGKPQGAIERWFPDGKLGYVMNHKNGRPDGPYKRWWPNGKPRLEANYVAGHLDGEFKNWLEDGTVYEFATYQRGNKIQTTRPIPPTPERGAKSRAR